MYRPRVFISFDFERDEALRNLLVWQARNEKTPFDIEDRSVKIPRNQDERKEKCKQKINKCDVVIVICWEETYHCIGVKAEIKMANELDIPVFWLKWYPNKTCPRPDGLLKYYEWTRDALKAILDYVKQ